MSQILFGLVVLILAVLIMFEVGAHHVDFRGIVAATHFPLLAVPLAAAFHAVSSLSNSFIVEVRRNVLALSLMCVF